MENIVDVFKVLSNRTRVDILIWLKNPLEHFDKPTAHLNKNISEKGGVCVGDMKMIQQVGLLESERHGQWTYYRRNEANINQLVNMMKKDL